MNRLSFVYLFYKIRLSLFIRKMINEKCLQNDKRSYNNNCNRLVFIYIEKQNLNNKIRRNCYGNFAECNGWLLV